MTDNPSDEQQRIYQRDARAYDGLISAEDADGNLVGMLVGGVPAGARLVDVGAGTGRLTRLLQGRVGHSVLVDRALPMLRVARERLGDMGARHAALLAGDVTRLPLADACADVAMAGWVFGHFRLWMPQGWEAQVDAAVAEMRRVVVHGGHVVILETLGTGHTEPRRHEGLDGYFARLEGVHGFTRRWVRTDYAFPDVDTAARVCGGFFGEAMAERIRRERWARVPECTGVWTRPA